MRRSARTTLAWLALFLVLPQLCLAKDRLGVEPTAAFSVRGINGYLISVEDEADSVSLTVTNGRGKRGNYSFARYSAKDTAPSVNQIEADFGDLGAISMAFEPSGEVEKETRKLSKDCAGPLRIVRRVGTFRGTIRFTGEGGYTTAEATEVSGSIGTPRTYGCIRVGPLRRLPFLRVTDEQNKLGAAAIGVRKQGQVRFEATSIERDRKVDILRHVLRTGPPSSFDVSANFRTATVTPPPPFSGIATFRRTSKGTPPDWSGSLSVSFPGRSDVPLTGPEFTFASLSRF